MTPHLVRARIDEIRERLACVAADRWIHEFRPDGEVITTVRAVVDRDGRKIGDEAPDILCRFGDEATWREKELMREARGDIAFLLDQLTGAGRMIRDLRSASRAGSHPSDAGAPAGRRTSADARSGLRPAADAEVSGDSGMKDFAAEASMKCAEAPFQRFLKESHATDDDGDLSDSANAAAVLRRVLGIGSRKDLNTDPDAAQRWRDLRADFQAWKWERGVQR